MSDKARLFLRTCTKITELKNSEKSRIVLVYSRITGQVYVVKYLESEKLENLYALYVSL